MSNQRHYNENDDVFEYSMYLRSLLDLQLTVNARFELFLVNEAEGEKKITEKPFAGKSSFLCAPVSFRVLRFMC